MDRQVEGGALHGFSGRAFTHRGTTHAVYRIGAGPGVILMHEFPGITPEAIELARRLVHAGYTVDLPHLFGQIGRPARVADAVVEAARICVRREFHAFASRRSSPLVAWLRALCRDLHAAAGGPGVGAIGMCITGNFALAMLVEPALMAPVLAEPSLPLALTGVTRRALHLSDAELAAARRRIEREDLKVLGLRFTGDVLCPAERFARLRSELGDAFEAIEIDGSRDNATGKGLPWAHSVLTLDFIDRAGHPTRAALDRVLSFLGERLRRPCSNQPTMAGAP